MIRICSYCRRACAGPDAIAFGEAWSDEQQIEASKTAPITHGVCSECFERNFGEDVAAFEDAS